MTAAGGGSPHLPSAVQQVVHAQGGHAYGAVGADIHVFGDGTPVYLLFEHRRVTGSDAQWLRAQPSRMLDARAEVVDFTGRHAELDALTTWRDSGARLAVRWLHGEGGQGKTRLAARLAAMSQSAGWRVVDAVHSTETHPPAEGSQDLRLGGHEGVLLLVDYADRWPLSDLSWLFQNRLLHQPVRARILLIGRSAIGWPALRGRLNRLRVPIDTSDQQVPPLPDDGHSRNRMFTAARDCFARHYPRISDPGAIAPPEQLGHPEFALTLAVHMAALVTVDAAAYGRRPPADMVGLTLYLLDREHEHWRQLYENTGGGLDFRTPDTVMARAVFTASLTGATDRETARSILERLLPGLPAEQILADHTLCYPPTDPGRTHALAPLLPDRLAEDFLALMLPGSRITGYPSDEWASVSTPVLLHRSHDGTVPRWVRRAVSFLAAAAARWPHVGRGHLYPVVLSDPRLVLEAGSAALTTLAQIGSTSPPVPGMSQDALDGDLLHVLEAVWEVMPDGRHVDLDIGILAVAERLAAHHLTGTTDSARRARLYTRLSNRRGAAGHYGEALAAGEEAARLYRGLAEADAAYLPNLAGSLHNLGLFLFDQGRREEGLAAARESVSANRRLAEANPGYVPGLANSLLNLGTWLWATGRREETLDATAEAVELFVELLARSNGLEYLSSAAQAMGNLGTCLLGMGRQEEALPPTKASAGMYRLLAEDDPHAHLPGLARQLGNLSNHLARLGRPEDALEPAEEAVAINRRLAKSNPVAFQYQLAVSLQALGDRLSAVGRQEESATVGEQAAAAHAEAARLRT
ncbi:tetratricopeptide repeat protein [Streptomyces sp. NPDC002054]|uniref:tetratricopeptide repeat protein n=1 Tax=Streptomyces sp. NPDC002054 TaxID=3154663 RepID=UPI0033262B85